MSPEMTMTDKSAKGTATSTTLIENDTTRVTSWRFSEKGDNTGWHRHEYDYVIVPLFDGFLEIESANGEVARADMNNGIPYFRKAGVEHDVINGNEFECSFVEIEFL